MHNENCIELDVSIDKKCSVGKLKYFSKNWQNLTNDRHVLDIVKHCHIEFVDNTTPNQIFIPREIIMSQKETEVLDAEILKLIDKGVIIEVDHSPGEFISTVFLRQKSNGNYRLILNLKGLNKYVEYKKFKMETLSVALNLLKKNCYMASVDLRDAYYSIPIAKEHQKLLRFTWRGKLYQYTVMPNGIACAPRYFTKLLKPAYSNLRSRGHVCLGYIDDSYLQGDNYEECDQNVNDTISLFSDLGFDINWEKSCTIPSQILEFLGFLLNSVEMSVKLTKRKIEKLKSLALRILNKEMIKIEELASLIGTIVSSFPGTEYGPLHYRTLECEKTQALRLSKGKFDEKMILSSQAKLEIDWWLSNIDKCMKKVSHGHPSIVICSDASLIGWGGIRNKSKTGGHWSADESNMHINALELKAVLFTLQSLCSTEQGTHIRARIDNTTAVAYINNMGGTKSLICNEIAKEIWHWCIIREIWISAEHLPGSQNVEADKESRVFHDNTEWMLDSYIFNLVCKRLGEVDIDLFASRLNKQIVPYVSWRPDPGALFIDAFSSNWANNIFYAFPPFSLLSRCLQKIEMDEAVGTIIVPCWPTQPWFPKLMRLIIKDPVLLPKNILSLPYNNICHPLHNKLRMMACRLSGKSIENEAYQKKLQTFYWPRGEVVQNFSMEYILNNGVISVLGGKLIPLYIMK